MACALRSSIFALIRVVDSDSSKIIGPISIFPNMLSGQVGIVSSRVLAPRVARVIATPIRRTYAVAVAPDPKPPLPLYGLDGTYASALVSPS